MTMMKALNMVEVGNKIAQKCYAIKKNFMKHGLFLVDQFPRAYKAQFNHHSYYHFPSCFHCVIFLLHILIFNIIYQLSFLIYI